MRETRVASRYAKSIIDLALQQGVLEAVHTDMKMIEDLTKNSPELSVFLRSPIIKTDKKRDVLKQLFGGKVNKMTEAFIDLMTSKKREAHLPAIATEFVNQYKRHKHVLTAVITTAAGLDDTLRKQVLELVKTSASSEVELIEKIDKKLIGGFVLRVGDKQVDASIQRKLQDLRKGFNENPYVKEF
jgi:F-type H+-transporting ATPase subunit delta